MIELDQNKLGRLNELLKKMDVPQIHKNPTSKDIPWLNRNLHIRNSKHANYEEALKIVQELLKEIIKHTP